jgi:hypothetical protein
MIKRVFINKTSLNEPLIQDISLDNAMDADQIL